MIYKSEAENIKKYLLHNLIQILFSLMRSPKHSVPDISSKINLLESNTNRVRSQNTALRKLLQDTESQKMLYEFMLSLREAENKISILKQKEKAV